MLDKETEEGASSVSSKEDQGSKQAGLFGSAGIELSKDEQAQPVTVKFLRYINDSLDQEVSKFRSFESQFYDKRQECEVLKKDCVNLQNELNRKKEMENLQKVMITTGSLLLGSLLKLVENQPSYALIAIAVAGIALIICGVFPVFQFGGKK
jgi:hypothetical protein